MNDFYVGVPFTGVEKFVPRIDLIATREDEAIGIAAGAWLAGKKPTVFMQNSGLGNSIDIITSLLKPYKIKFDLLINERKEPEHHALMGKITRNLIKLVEYENSTRYC